MDKDSRARNYVQNLGFLSENQPKKLGFPKIFRISIWKTQVWGWVSENGLTKCFDSALRFFLSRHVYVSWRHEFWLHFSWSEQELENLAQNLDFLHHFWMSRESGNPVILSPGEYFAIDTYWHQDESPSAPWLPPTSRDVSLEPRWARGEPFWPFLVTKPTHIRPLQGAPHAELYSAWLRGWLDSANSHSSLLIHPDCLLIVRQIWK